MSNAVYPTLPGLTCEIDRSLIAPPVVVKTTPSQREFRARNAIAIRYRYTLRYEFLRTAAAFAELQNLAGFFALRGGNFDSFRFTDPDDNTCANELFATGDGVTTQFQLLHNFGSFAEPLFDFNGGLSVFDNGTNVGGGASVSSAGLVTFTTAPVAGHSLTWTGQFYRRCRFDVDSLDTSKFLQGLWEAKSVNLLTVPA